MKTFMRNLNDLYKLLELSKGMNLTIFRLGSNFIPFASHPQFNEEWFNDIEGELKKHASEIIKFSIRITMHPGQYVVLNSPSSSVLKRSLKEVNYHFWLLDVLGLKESVVVIHMGGSYGDKRKAVNQFMKTMDENPWLTRRLALENDERFYTIEEIIEIAESYGIPAVFDYHHHRLNPSNFNIDRLISTWKGRVPEVHLSSDPKGAHRFGEHGNYIELKDFESLISILNEDQFIDIILEAKMKEKAIIRLMEDIKARSF
ncbi:MAG: UV DNA damage repair endonuclease UvsE [Candidatus Methanomethyliaceae archaeon]|nr:UV DNA damage repair endonuclease UvsE [Candidatus Methanomethyliaceae archaeon]MDW7970529.1 UV DNA damage repair endonuclease UvsE [Nitrososphaerota archaeon]